MRSEPRLALLEYIQSEAGITDSEMRKTFNGGIGFAMVVREKDADGLVAFLRRRKTRAHRIGRIARGRKSVKYV